MSRPAADDRPEIRVLIQVGLLLWLVSSGAVVWEVLASQAPDSPFHVGVLVGPVTQLRSFTFALGAGLLVASWLWPSLFAVGQGRAVVTLLVAGAVVHTAALLAAASQGLLAVQIVDPRADARWLLYTRGAGHALATIGLASVCLRALRKPR